MEIIVSVEILVLVLLLVLAAVLTLVVRRRWLSRSAVTFECSARLDVPLAAGSAAAEAPVDPPTPRPRWALGVARYNGEFLEWFRYFSFSSKPQLSWQRTGISVVETRQPDSVEAISLYNSHRIVRIGSIGSQYELAMDAGSITGFMAWLEAAPPGTTRTSISPG